MAGADFRLQLDHRAIAELADDPETLDLLDDLGEDAVQTARELAPKDTGAGAASIFAEVSIDRDGAYVAVSYDDQHTYMGLQEIGTADEPPHPFLRPALDQLRL